MPRLPLELIERLRAARVAMRHAAPGEVLSQRAGLAAVAVGVYFAAAAVIEVWRFLVADLLKPLWAFVRWFLLAIVMVLLLGVTPAVAVEAWCAANPSNCVCQNDLGALRGTSWTNISSNFWGLQPTTADGSFCGGLNSSLPQIWAPGGTPTLVASGFSGINATRHPYTVQMEASSGQMSGLGGRLGSRYYFRLGTGYQSTGQGGCTNDKYIELGGSGQNYFTACSATNFCWGGVGNLGVGPADFIGEWMRAELYTTDVDSTSRTYEMYLTRVSDGEEWSLTGLPCAEPCPATITYPAGLHRFRQDTCNGSHDMMLWVMGHWTTNAGQRIGAASEVEGEQPVTGQGALAGQAATLTGAGTSTSPSVGTSSSRRMIGVVLVFFLGVILLLHHTMKTT